MCVRELNFRFLLRGLRADSLFAYRSKSSRVSVPLMRMLYPMGHYCSTGFVRKCIAGFREKGWERFATLWGIRGEFGTTCISKPRVFQKTLVYFNGLIPRSCSTLPLLSFHLAAA